MKHPETHQPVQAPHPAVARPLDTDDDADLASPQGASDADHDVRYESTTRDKPGLVDNAASHAEPPTVDFNFGPQRERRRH